MFIKNITVCALVCIGTPLSFHAMEQVPLRKIDLALIDAAKNNNLTEATKQLQLGAQINPTAAHTTALIEACAQEGDNEKLVELLLESKAEPNLPNRDLATPMHFAVQRNKAGILTLLQKAGAKVSTQDNDGNTPLHIASSTQALNSICWLGQAEADLNAINRAGLTPLHIAVLESQICSYALLLHYGARVDVASEPCSMPNQARTLSPGSTVFHASTQIDVFNSCMQKAFISQVLFDVGTLSSKAFFTDLRNIMRANPGVGLLLLNGLMPDIATFFPVDWLTGLLKIPDTNGFDLGVNVLKQRTLKLQAILRKTDNNNQTALMKETQKNGNVQSPKTLLDPASYAPQHLAPFIVAVRTNTLDKLPDTNVFKIAYEDALPKKEEEKTAPQTQSSSGSSCVIC